MLVYVVTYSLCGRSDSKPKMPWKHSVFGLGAFLYGKYAVVPDKIHSNLQSVPIALIRCLRGAWAGVFPGIFA